MAAGEDQAEAIVPDHRIIDLLFQRRPRRDLSLAASSACLSANRRRRRRTSIALLCAVVVIQPPALAGMRHVASARGRP